MTKFRISERRSCKLLGVWQSSCHYQPKPDEDAALGQQLTELAHERPRFEYRRLSILLKRKGQYVNDKKLFRVYREAGSVKRTRRKKLIPEGVSKPALSAPN